MEGARGGGREEDSFRWLWCSNVHVVRCSGLIRLLTSLVVPCSKGIFNGDSTDPALRRCSDKRVFTSTDGLVECSQDEKEADPCCCAEWAAEICFSAASRPAWLPSVLAWCAMLLACWR